MKYQLQTTDGRMASYNIRTGPFLTDNFANSYTYETRAQAESQLPLYEQALNVKLHIVEIP